MKAKTLFEAGRAQGALLLLAAAAVMSSCAAPSKPPPAPPPPTRPPPADVSDCRLCHAGTGDYPLAADVYEFWESSGHGMFLNRPRQRPDCDSCHDLGGEAGEGHLDGKKNSPTANTFHLVKGFIHQDPQNEWDFQVRFDEHCWTACHKPAGIEDMRHERDGTPAKGAVQMGTHATYEKPYGGYPMDADLALFRGSSTPPHYIPCVSCHDPHGTGTASRTGGSNRMSRESFKAPARLCSRCHI